MNNSIIYKLPSTIKRQIKCFCLLDQSGEKPAFGFFTYGRQTGISPSNHPHLRKGNRAWHTGNFTPNKTIGENLIRISIAKKLYAPYTFASHATVTDVTALSLEQFFTYENLLRRLCNFYNTNWLIRGNNLTCAGSTAVASNALHSFDLPDSVFWYVVWFPASHFEITRLSYFLS
jgi:hypothetical protein